MASVSKGDPPFHKKLNPSQPISKQETVLIKSTQILSSPDVLDGDMENVNFAQLLTLSVAGAGMRDLLAQLVKAGVDLSLPLTLPSIRLLPPVPENNQTSP